MKTTQKEIRNFSATDITNWCTEDVTKLARIQPLKCIAYSTGIYGINGLVVYDVATGEFFKVVDRSTNLFALM